MIPPLKVAAEYIQTLKAPQGFLGLIASIKRVFNFTQERTNRLTRYVIIAREYKRGTPVNEIAEKHGCSRHTVQRYARMADLPKRPKHFPEQLRNEVIADYKANLPVADIARLHGVSQAYVSKVAREEGMLRRKFKK
jgi:transposase-like protein